MVHSIRDPARMLDDDVTVSTDYFQATVDQARSLGFETITTSELIAFLTDNARIPPRSMILIVDDRRPGVVADYILPVAEAFDWTVTLGWIIGDTRPSLWSTMEEMAQGGRLDVQSHGLNHRYIVEGMPEEEIRLEIAGPIPILEEHFGYRPTAFVWPGGNFTRRSAEIAREEGYQLGFHGLLARAAAFRLDPAGCRGASGRRPADGLAPRLEPIGDLQSGASGGHRRPGRSFLGWEPPGRSRLVRSELRRETAAVSGGFGPSTAAAGRYPGTPSDGADTFRAERRSEAAEASDRSRSVSGGLTPLRRQPADRSVSGGLTPPRRQPAVEASFLLHWPPAGPGQRALRPVE